MGAAAQIRGEILALRDAGCAVLVVSEELDELFEICDRLHVIAKGQLSPSIDRADATVEQIGEWMSGLWHDDAQARRRPRPRQRGGPMLKLEARAAALAASGATARRCWRWPITVLIGVALFIALGKDPVQGLQVFFWEPVKTPYALGELVVKATPLLLIALGLAVCFRSNVWNIGAEGQFIIGAIAAGGVALLAGTETGRWIVRAILLAGVLGGMVWAGITALLRDRFNANEILVSLMLVYVADMVLSLPGLRPLEGPDGLQLPADRHLRRGRRRSRA